MPSVRGSSSAGSPTCITCGCGARTGYVRRSPIRRSLQTNIWWDADTRAGTERQDRGPKPSSYDFDLITQSVARMVEEEDMWRRYFTAVGADPLVIFYEDLVSDPERCVKSILQMLEVSPAEDFGSESTGFRRQADDITTAWAAKYRSEIARGPYDVWRATGPRKDALEPTSAELPADVRRRGIRRSEPRGRRLRRRSRSTCPQRSGRGDG